MTRPPSTGASAADAPAHEALFDRISAILEAAKRVDFRGYKRPTMERRVRRRMMFRRVDRLDEYVRLLEQDPAEVGALFDDLLILVTRFFRDADSFEALRRQFLPLLFEEHEGTGPIRVWCAGCSTGEEAYSIAILLLESSKERATEPPIMIFATDLSEPALKRARAGLYSSRIAADVSPERLSRFFTRSDGGYRINMEVRQLCLFARHDVTRDPPFSNLDLILCRNVLMYMGERLQRTVLDKLHFGLKPNGVLMLGRAETVQRHSAALFVVLDATHRFYAKVAGSRRPLSMYRPMIPAPRGSAGLLVDRRPRDFVASSR